MKSFLLTLFLLYPCAAEACRPAYVSTSERIRQANLVYFGYVTAIHLQSFEAQKMKDGHFVAQEILVGSEIKTYRIVVIESFKGGFKKIRNVEIEECGGGEAVLGSRVVVYSSKIGNYIELLSEEQYKNFKSGVF